MKSCSSDSRTRLLTGLALAVLLAASPALGQAPVFRLDFNSTNDTIFKSTIDPPPIINSADGPFTVTVVLSGAKKLVMVNCDLVFDPAHLRVVNTQETYGDVNWDGRANVFDIREVGSRLNATVESKLYHPYYDRAGGRADGLIDLADVDAISAFFAKPGIFWTVNTDDATIRESAEVFEDPTVSNENGKIDDIVCVLLPRQHPPAPGVEGGTLAAPAGFGFNGDARIAEITFQPVNGFAGETTLSFTGTSAVTEDSVFVGTQIQGELQPSGESVNITIQ
jgi:hypothetical protein